jgi:general secretion pathway protein G
MQTHSHGFTLIELLVVIAIIGILSSIVLASLNTARTKANDAARISDVGSIKTAMELYYNSNNTYPQYGGAGNGYAISNLSSYLVPTDISSIPSILVSDGDQYVWGTNQYGMYIYTAANGWCLTGVNVNTGWWGNPPACNF